MYGNKIHRPPRCSHCHVCDYCVEKFDHHCPWLGTCIAKKNYVSFIFYVISKILLLGFDLAVCVIGVLHFIKDSITALEVVGIIVFSLFALACLGVS